MLSPFISRRDKFGSDNWTPNDLIREFHAFAAARRDEDDSMDPRNSAGALEWRIQQLQRSAQILDDTRHLDLRMLFQPGQCTVLQLDEVDRREQQVVVAVLLRRLYQARQNAERGRSSDGTDLNVPYPAFVLLEEPTADRIKTPHDSGSIYSNPVRRAERARDLAPLAVDIQTDPRFAPEPLRAKPTKPPEDLTFEDLFGHDKGGE
jgi:hypothetical protein